MSAIEPLTDAQEKKVHEPDEKWADSFALKIVRADYEAAIAYRRQYEAKWQEADYLYHGWQRARHWEGTKIPRSSLSMFVVFSQIEALLPKILSTIFSEKPWFEVGPEPGTTGTTATRVRDFMLRQFERVRRIKDESVREVFRRALKSACIYGNGIVETGWMVTTSKRKKFSREAVPVTRWIEHPVYGRLELPTDEPPRLELTEREVETRHAMPFYKYVSIKDFFHDPHCSSPQPSHGRYAGTEAYMTVDEVLAFDKKPGFKIPPKTELLEMAKHKPQAQSDVTKATPDNVRGMAYAPGMDSSADPGSKRIHVVCYWTPERCVWMANSEKLFYNAVNPYGRIPYRSPFYTDVLDRMDGISVADVTGNEQHLQGGVINARVDDLALNLHGTRIKKLGTPRLRGGRYPGRVDEAANPKEDIVNDPPPQPNQQAFIEVQASEQRVARTTGITDISVMGVASSGGNSANRTASGINTQASAAFSRLLYIVENNEDCFIEPFLGDWHHLNTIFLNPYELIELYGELIDPLDILNADVVFTMRASSKMQSRQMLAQNFPLVAQSLMNPAFSQQLAAQNLTVDWIEVGIMLLDVTGYKTRGEIIRKMTPEEIKIANTPKPESDLKQKLQDSRMADLKELKTMDHDANMQQAIVERGLDAALEPEEVLE